MTTEELPVRILHPAIEQRFVRLIERVLQVVQTNEQTDVLSGRASLRAVTIRESDVEAIPVNLPGQKAERVVEIQQLIKLRLEKVELTGFRTRFGLHAGLKLQGFEGR